MLDLPCEPCCESKHFGTGHARSNLMLFVQSTKHLPGEPCVPEGFCTNKASTCQQHSTNVTKQNYMLCMYCRKSWWASWLWKVGRLVLASPRFFCFTFILRETGKKARQGGTWQGWLRRRMSEVDPRLAFKQRCTLFQVHHLNHGLRFKVMKEKPWVEM